MAALGPVIPAPNGAGSNKGRDATKLGQGGTSGVGPPSAFARGGAGPPAIAAPVIIEERQPTL